MTLEEILSKLESEDLKESIVSLINDEKERGITATRKKDKENLKLKTDLKDLGWDKDEYPTFDEFKESRSDIKKTATDSKLTIATLNDKLNSLTDELVNERVEAKRIKRVSKENKLSAELTSKISGSFFGAEYLIKTLISDGKVDLDETTGAVFFKNGDEVIPFDKGLETLKNDNKDMLKVSQQGGTGDKGGNGVPQVDDDLMSKPTNDILDSLGL